MVARLTGDAASDFDTVTGRGNCTSNTLDTVFGMAILNSGLTRRFFRASNISRAEGGKVSDPFERASVTSRTSESEPLATATANMRPRAAERTSTEKTIEAQIVDHIEYLKKELGKDGGTLKDITEHTNPKEASPYIVGKLQGFLEKGKLSGS